jgi:hypothetical protein
MLQLCRGGQIILKTNPKGRQSYPESHRNTTNFIITVVASCDASRMMFDEDRTGISRAYVGLPDDQDKDLAAAIGWCLDQADGNARAVGVQVASKRGLEDAPQLAAFLKAGAKAYPNFRGKMPALPSGPVLLYRPFAMQLWEVVEFFPCGCGQLLKNTTGEILEEGKRDSSEAGSCRQLGRRGG